MQTVVLRAMSPSLHGFQQFLPSHCGANSSCFLLQLLPFELHMKLALKMEAIYSVESPCGSACNILWIKSFRITVVQVAV